MYVQKTYEKRSGRTFLSFVESIAMPGGKTKKVLIESIGYLDEYLDQYDDPLAHFKAVAEERSKLKKQEEQVQTYSYTYADLISENPSGLFNIGYMPLSQIYHKLNIRQFWLNRQRNLKIKFQLDSIFRLLVYGRVIFPGSKKATWEKRNMLFEKIDCTLTDVYRSLKHFDYYKEDFLAYVHKQVSKVYGRNTTTVRYDVTNYYFEIDEEDELRKKGVSKEGKRSPIVQMGLLTDQQGLPISYELFPGNTNDSQTLMPVLQRVRKTYDIGRFIVVGDRGINTADNIAMAQAKGDGYVYGQSIRKATKELKDYALDESGYRYFGEEKEGFKIKSRVVPRTYEYTDPDGRTHRVSLDQKQVFFYSPKYARREQKKRGELLDKAEALVEDKGKRNRDKQYGAAKYVREIYVNDSTGEVIDEAEIVCIDETKIADDAKYDGYYAVISSELDLEDSELMDIYKELWRIEDSFKITKSDLESRPAFVTIEEHINAHFLTCFIALLLLRLLQLETEHRYPMKRLVTTMRSLTCGLMNNNDYMCHTQDGATEALGKPFGINYDLKHRNRKAIEKMRKPR